MFCRKCGSQIDDNTKFCPYCGEPTGRDAAGGTTYNYYSEPAGQAAGGIAVSPKNWLAALLLEIFLGVLGVHRFYVGKIGTGILWLITLGWFGIGWIVDLVLIASGDFKDKQGRYLKSESWQQAHSSMNQNRYM